MSKRKSISVKLSLKGRRSTDSRNIDSPTTPIAVRREQMQQDSPISTQYSTPIVSRRRGYNIFLDDSPSQFHDDQQSSPVSPFQFTQDNANKLDVSWKWNKSPTACGDAQTIRPRQLTRRLLRPKVEENRYVQPPEKKQLRGFYKFHKELLLIQNKQKELLKENEEISLDDDANLIEKKNCIDMDPKLNGGEVNFAEEKVTNNFDIEKVDDLFSESVLDNFFSDFNTSEIEKNAMSCKNDLKKSDLIEPNQKIIEHASSKLPNSKIEGMKCSNSSTFIPERKAPFATLIESKKDEAEQGASSNFDREELMSGMSNQQRKSSFQPTVPNVYNKNESETLLIKNDNVASKFNDFPKSNVSSKPETITINQLNSNLDINKHETKTTSRITAIKPQIDPFDPYDDDFLMSIPLDKIISDALTQNKVHNHSQIKLNPTNNPNARSTFTTNIQSIAPNLQSQRQEFSRNKSSTQFTTKVEPVSKAFQRYKSSGSFETNRKDEKKYINVSNNITRVQSDPSSLANRPKCSMEEIRKKRAEALQKLKVSRNQKQKQ